MGLAVMVLAVMVLAVIGFYEKRLAQSLFSVEPLLHEWFSHRSIASRLNLRAWV
jgi:hypothetical protein